mmetsp:Transcript_27025/g.73325  ORF Transcript_27025/g.73325 Transcript_27025/m.73325 type:complete len:219 (+) Transcript_27025:196-852(+)
MVQHVQRRPQGALSEDVLGDAGVVAVLDAGELLHGAHRVAVGHGRDHEHDVPERREDNHLEHGLFAEQRATSLAVAADEYVQIVRQVRADVPKVGTVEAPPDLVPHAVHTEASPINDSAVQLPSLVAPEVGIVRVHVHVPQGNIVWIRVLPVLDLAPIGIPRHEGVHELLPECLGGDALWEERPRDHGHKLIGGLQLPLDALGLLARARVGVRAPSLW